uniref:Uncharacterized protein n=1 Tax=Romanomermis culicivorax TaxID=13658 RepID=A0A915I8F9_ROMCU
MTTSTPKNGNVADPGFKAVQPVPKPSGRIDRFTDGTQNFQATTVVPCYESVVFFHEGSDGCRSSIKFRYTILVDDAPETPKIRFYLVYNMNNGSSASIHSTSQIFGELAIIWWYQTSISSSKFI